MLINPQVSSRAARDPFELSNFQLFNLQPLNIPLSSGKITKLAAQHNNPDRISVFIDGEFAFGVYQDLLLEYELRVGKVLREAEQQEIQSRDEVFIAKAVALNYLSYRARTEKEVRTKLARKGFSETVADAVIERLYALHYLDDAAYARSFVSGRFRSRGYGPARIRGDLMRRGVDRPLIEDALEEVLEPEETLEAAKEQAEKRWARLASEPDPAKRRKKLSDFLVRRGFSYDVVRRVLEEVTRG
jgi:regulatory protein